MSARICVESGAVCKSLHCATVCVLRLERQDAPPATSAEPVAEIRECEACFTPDVCQVREKHVYHGIDRANPRAEITVQPLQAQQADLLAGV